MPTEKTSQAITEGWTPSNQHYNPTRDKPSSAVNGHWQPPKKRKEEHKPQQKYHPPNQGNHFQPKQEELTQGSNQPTNKTNTTMIDNLFMKMHNHIEDDLEFAKHKRDRITRIILLIRLSCCWFRNWQRKLLLWWPLLVQVLSWSNILKIHS